MTKKVDINRILEAHGYNTTVPSRFERKPLSSGRVDQQRKNIRTKLAVPVVSTSPERKDPTNKSAPREEKQIPNKIERFLIKNLSAPLDITQLTEHWSSGGNIVVIQKGQEAFNEPAEDCLIYPTDIRPRTPWGGRCVYHLFLSSDTEVAFVPTGMQWQPPVEQKETKPVKTQAEKSETKIYELVDHRLSDEQVVEIKQWLDDYPNGNIDFSSNNRGWSTGYQNAQISNDRIITIPGLFPLIFKEKLITKMKFRKMR
ncbi:hypothetical protein A2335_02630 [Candidatus Peregrinibacteria bacterium RIFOXYB2_FULL_32_7]|nr:MAG: hypothetical protein A2335_02630 [Candidatus Peregrinibacteria bacterium RIFOXYB2_FULL_32_7]